MIVPNRQPRQEKPGAVNVLDCLAAFDRFPQTHRAETIAPRSG